MLELAAIILELDPEPDAAAAPSCDWDLLKDKDWLDASVSPSSIVDGSCGLATRRGCPDVKAASRCNSVLPLAYGSSPGCKESVFGSKVPHVVRPVVLVLASSGLFLGGGCT